MSEAWHDYFQFLRHPGQYFTSLREHPAWRRTFVIQWIGYALMISFLIYFGGNRFGAANLKSVLGLFTFLVGPIVSLLIFTFYIIVQGFWMWLSLKMFRLSLTYKQCMRIVIHASLISFLNFVIILLVEFFSSGNQLHFLTLGMFVSSNSKWSTLLSSIGVFSIWQVYVFTVAVSVFNGVSKWRALPPVILMEVIPMLPALFRA